MCSAAVLYLSHSTRNNDTTVRALRALDAASAVNSRNAHHDVIATVLNSAGSAESGQLHNRKK